MYILTGKKSDTIVVKVFDTTKPINNFSVKSVGNSATFATKVPKIINKKIVTILDKNSAIMFK
jgi:hypothetical protein